MNSMNEDHRGSGEARFRKTEAERLGYTPIPEFTPNRIHSGL